MNTQNNQTLKNANNYKKARERVFTVRLTQEEADRINRAIELTQTSKAAVIRAALDNIQIRTPNPKLTTGVLRELSAIGNNTNQIAKAANIAKESGLEVVGAGAIFQEIKDLLIDIRDRL